MFVFYIYIQASIVMWGWGWWMDYMCRLGSLGSFIHFSEE